MKLNPGSGHKACIMKSACLGSGFGKVLETGRIEKLIVVTEVVVIGLTDFVVSKNSTYRYEISNRKVLSNP